MHRRVETNEQNAKIGRHLSLIGTAMRDEDFFRAAGEKLLDVHSYHDPLCKFCRTRTRRALPDVFEILVTGTEQSEVHLIAAWIPSDDLLHPLAADGITIVAHSLDVIPRRAVEANHFYHIWDGTEQQGHEFRGAIWAPDWMNPDIPLNRMLRKHELIFETIMKNADYLIRNLVYGEVLGSLVYIPRIRAEDLVQVHTILRANPTWGEFRDGVSPRINAETGKWFEGSHLPSYDEPFAAPWPFDDDLPFPQQEQIQVLPRDVITLSQIKTTTLSGERLEIPIAAEFTILKILLTQD